MHDNKCTYVCYVLRQRWFSSNLVLCYDFTEFNFFLLRSLFVFFYFFTMDTTLVQLFCKLINYCDGRIDSKLRELSELKSEAKYGFNNSRDKFQIPVFPRQFFAKIKENPLMSDRCLISTDKTTTTMFHPFIKQIGCPQRTCQICDSLGHTAKECPEFLSLKLSKKRTSVETQTDFPSTVHSSVSASPAAAESAWPAPSAESDRSATPAHRCLSSSEPTAKKSRKLSFKTLSFAKSFSKNRKSRSVLKLERKPRCQTASQPTLPVAYVPTIYAVEKSKLSMSDENSSSDSETDCEVEDAAPIFGSGIEIYSTKTLHLKKGESARLPIVAIPPIKSGSGVLLPNPYYTEGCSIKFLSVNMCHTTNFLHVLNKSDTVSTIANVMPLGTFKPNPM